MMSYRQKVIQSGNYIELYNYETPIKIGHKRKPRKQKRKNISAPEKDKNTQLFMRDFSVRRTRSRIARLINANPDLKNFLTLTFKESTTDLREANKIFHNFIKRLKRRYPNLKYLAVPEFQKDTDYYGRIKPEGGSVHYHVLINLEYVHFSEMTEIWGQGSVDLHTIRHVHNVGHYISKYIGKDLFDRRYFGMRKVLYSRNLDRPKIVVFARSVKEYLLTQTQKLKTLFEAAYVSDYQGRVDYGLYQMAM